MIKLIWNESQLPLCLHRKGRKRNLLKKNYGIKKQNRKCHKPRSQITNKTNNRANRRNADSNLCEDYYYLSYRIEKHFSFKALISTVDLVKVFFPRIFSIISFALFVVILIQMINARMCIMCLPFAIIEIISVECWQWQLPFIFVSVSSSYLFNFMRTIYNCHKNFPEWKITNVNLMRKKKTEFHFPSEHNMHLQKNGSNHCNGKWNIASASRRWILLD